MLVKLFIIAYLLVSLWVYSLSYQIMMTNDKYRNRSDFELNVLGTIMFIVSLVWFIALPVVWFIKEEV